MIRYPEPFSVIQATVDKRKPRWAEKAKERTELFAKLGKYTETHTVGGRIVKLSEFWGEVKDVFIDLQYGKCIYCEMALEDGENSPIQWDLEHFRPKGNVRIWPTASGRYPFSTGDPMPEGYYLLAYHLGNYAAACKTCNSPYKSDFFPIAGKRVVGGATPEAHASEQAFLVYPIGDAVEDPQDFIAFRGVEAVARNGSHRGQVMIDFFDLNRDGLQGARARWLRYTVWPNVKLALQGDREGIEDLEFLLSLAAPHTNCTRSFVELCRSDYARAQALIPVFESLIKKYPPK